MWVMVEPGPPARRCTALRHPAYPRKGARVRHLDDALEGLIVGKHINSCVGYLLAVKDARTVSIFAKWRH